MLGPNEVADSQFCEDYNHKHDCHIENKVWDFWILNEILDGFSQSCK